MKPFYKFIPLLSISLFVIGTGLLIDRVGNIGVRTDNSGPTITLQAPGSLVPGVPFTARWSGNTNIGDRPIALQLVTQGGRTTIGQGTLFAASVVVTTPCTVDSNASRIELVDTTNNALLASHAVELLPAGPDCVR